VFALVADPVGSRFVDSLARPGGNVTGFSWVDYGIGAKWLELLKEIAPNVTRAAVLRDPAKIAGIGQWGAIQSASRCACRRRGDPAAMSLTAMLLRPTSPSSRQPFRPPPIGGEWIHEIKRDGYGMMVRRDVSGVRLLTRNGKDWTGRFPTIVQAAAGLKARSCLIDGEAVA
jgi:ATP-dependent DNA ligase